ncbi:MAG: hypothetical protein ACT4QC_21360 [Planctomycetaceae bacterium]
MQQQTKGPLILSILIITVGVGWLLTAKGVGPGINWVWTLGLGGIGIVVFVVSGGVDKASVVLGPFFLIASFFSLLRQTGRMVLETEVPSLVITIGVLLLLAQAPFVPPPRWLVPLRENDAARRE